MVFSYKLNISVLVLFLLLLYQSLPAEEQPLVGLQFRPLSQLLKSIISDPKLDGAILGAKVVDVETDNVIFAYNPDVLINPASVTKVFTSAAALSLLHPNFRFKTEIYARSQPKKGVISGSLYIKGYADPFLVNERLHYLASELRSLGIRQINGPLVLDDRYLDKREQGPGWNQDTSSKPYQAPMGALSLNFNSVAVLLFPSTVGKLARVELVPQSSHLI